MDCMANYIDKDGKEQRFYWDSNSYGSKKDCEEQMKKQGIEYKEITGIWSSD